MTHVHTFASYALIIYKWIIKDIEIHGNLPMFVTFFVWNLEMVLACSVVSLQ